MSQLRIECHVAAVDLTDPCSIVVQATKIWHACLDLLSVDNRMCEEPDVVRPFDNYDVCKDLDVLVADFVEDVRALKEFCAERGITVA